MRVIWKSKTEIDEMIRNNLLVNSHTLAHWTQYRSFLDDTEIPEAAAIIIRNDTGKILLKKRGPKSYDSSGKWENTGGKIEKDEGIVSGLKREVKEEIDVNVKVTSHINTRVTTNPAGDTYRVYLFEGLIDSGNPKIMEPGKCTELNWVDPKNLGQYDLAEYTEEDFRFTGEL
jgi:mutator protein MutT